MNALEILNDRITVNQINGKTEAVAALREVLEAIQALPATGDAGFAEIQKITDAALTLTETYKAERDAALKRVEELEHARNHSLAWVCEIFRLLGLPEGDMGALEKFRAERDAALAKAEKLAKKLDIATERIAIQKTELSIALAKVERLKATTVPVEIVYGSHGDHDSWRLWVIDAQMERILLSAGVASTYAECVAKAKDWIGSQHKAKDAQG